MNDRDRISNLEEMAAEVFIKLDKVENDLKSVKTGLGQLGGRTGSMEDILLGLAHRQTIVDDSNAILKQSLLELTQVSKKNSREIESTARNTLNKDDLAKLFEYMMLRFDAIEERFKRIEERIDRMEERIDRIEERLDRIEARIDRIEERLDRIEARLDRVEERLDRVEIDVKEVRQELNARK
nr:hypothetical protein [uncultured Dyadobacter sp.]